MFHTEFIFSIQGNNSEIIDIVLILSVTVEEILYPVIKWYSQEGFTTYQHYFSVNICYNNMNEILKEGDLING